MKCKYTSSGHRMRERRCLTVSQTRDRTKGRPEAFREGDAQEVLPPEKRKKEEGGREGGREGGGVYYAEVDKADISSFSARTKKEKQISREGKRRVRKRDKHERQSARKRESWRGTQRERESDGEAHREKERERGRGVRQLQRSERKALPAASTN